MLRLYLALIAAICLYGCNTGERQAGIPVQTRDTSIQAANSYTDIFLDSARLDAYLRDREPSDSTGRLMRNFYNSRNYQAAWFSEKGLLTPQALAFWNLHEQHFRLTGDSSIFDRQLHQTMDLLVAEDSSLLQHLSLLYSTELQLTEHFFQFARFAYAGSLDPNQLQWYIPRKKVDAVQLLDSLLVHQGNNLDNWEPVNPMYAKVRAELKRYYDLERGANKDSVSMGSFNKLTFGDSNAVVQQLRKRLFLLGDLSDTTGAGRYDSLVFKGVQRAQRRFGISPNGIADRRLVQALNVPFRLRIEQLLVNMERMRWVPRQPKGAHILVNIPEFRMHVFADSGKVMDMRIVVGKAGNNTVVFNDLLRYVVFSPYWNVPASIVRNELLPAMRRSPNYLARKNMEQTGTQGGLPVIRQKPGGGNSLGRVKFLFPNSYNIYIYDTPSKSLFSQDKRAFSHGCIRLAEPAKLAAWLLRDQPSWTTEKIKKAMYQDKEQWVTVKQPVPVFISYFTAWVDREGLLHFRDDIYGHDAEMKARMFSKVASK